jgi:hypothetical protein
MRLHIARSHPIAVWRAVLIKMVRGKSWPLLFCDGHGVLRASGCAGVGVHEENMADIGLLHLGSRMRRITKRATTMMTRKMRKMRKATKKTAMRATTPPPNPVSLWTTRTGTRKPPVFAITF